MARGKGSAVEAPEKTPGPRDSGLHEDVAGREPRSKTPALEGLWTFCAGIGWRPIQIAALG